MDTKFADLYRKIILILGKEFIKHNTVELNIMIPENSVGLFINLYKNTKYVTITLIEDNNGKYRICMKLWNDTGFDMERVSLIKSWSTDTFCLNCDNDYEDIRKILLDKYKYEFLDEFERKFRASWY